MYVGTILSPQLAHIVGPPTARKRAVGGPTMCVSWVRVKVNHFNSDGFSYSSMGLPIFVYLWVHVTGRIFQIMMHFCHEDLFLSL